MSELSPESIGAYLTDQFPDLQPKSSWGETSFFLNPGNRFAHGAYFATIKEKDGDNDRASNLDRDGVFRLNFGPGKPAYKERFGEPPPRPAKGEIVQGPWDFIRKDILMPHPVYGWMGWLCVLNPSQETFTDIKPLLEVAYQKAAKTIQKRVSRL